MKSKLLVTLLTVTLVMASLTGCGTSSNNVPESTETVTEAPATTPEETEAPHEHSYTETITKEATCLEDGEATFTCECGDTYTETVPATGHDFSNYVSNEDATYEADGTETATCACGETDTRVAEGSMLTYTYTDMDATKYAKSTVNIRSLPNSDSENLGSLSTNDEVKVTGKCNETGWYRIEYSDGIAYVSDEYLVDEKVEAKTEAKASAPAPAPAASNLPTYATYAEARAYAISLGYPIGSAVDNGDGSYTGYYIKAIDNAGYWCKDIGWVDGGSADYDSSYQVGDSLVGKITYDVGNYNSIKLAYVNSECAWYVTTYRSW